MKILIDNGHGSNTRGKCSPDRRLMEWQWAREIANRLRNQLQLRGYDVDLLVPEDADIPLGERVSRCNAYCDRLGTRNVMLISIHINACGMGDRWYNATGWSAWTYYGNSNSDKLANCLYQSADKHLTPLGKKIRKDYADGDADFEASFAILKRTRCTAVLTENMFQDNQTDVDWLLSDQGKRTIVNLHAEGITNFIEKI